MSLFSQLLNLNTGSIPLEDFFTELVAHLFSKNKEILYAWLKDLNLLDTDTYLDVHISTQREFEPLDGHLLGSRPDLLIELIDDRSSSLIFIESKIASQEGYEQLSRYAEILHKLPGFHKKYFCTSLVTLSRKIKQLSLRTFLTPSSTLSSYDGINFIDFFNFIQAQCLPKKLLNS